MKFILLIFTVILAVVLADEKKVVCYYSSWAVYRDIGGRLEVSEIDPKLCTHLIYAFIGLNSESAVIHLDAWNDLPDGGGKNNMNNFIELRQQSPGTKFLVAVGGWNEGCAKFSTMAGNPITRQRFIESAVAFVKKHGFDGVDIDWEYPAANLPGSSPADKQNFISLLKELKKRFDQEGLLLSAAVAAPESTASIAYDIAEISKYLDFINLMAYDFHVASSGKTGMNAPLYPSSLDSSAESKLNIDASVHYWLSQGAPASKIVLGVPFYGRTFALSNLQLNDIGASAKGAGIAGPYTLEPGNLGYNEICEKFLNEQWDVKYDEEQKVPYAINGEQWVSFDNERSIKEKTDYIKKFGLGGVMIWSIETDDIMGKCGEKFSLLKSLNRELRNEASSSPKLQTENKQQTEQEYQEPEYQQPNYQHNYEEPKQQYGSSNTAEICQADGYVRNPHDCSQFYYCQFYNGEYLKYLMQCQQSLVYDVATGVCNYANAVQC